MNKSEISERAARAARKIATAQQAFDPASFPLAEHKIADIIIGERAIAESQAPDTCNCGSHKLAPFYHRPECPKATAAQKQKPQKPGPLPPEGIEWLKRDEGAGAFAQGYKLYAWDADAEEYMPVTGYVVSGDGLRVELQTDSDEEGNENV